MMWAKELELATKAAEAAQAILTTGFPVNFAYDDAGVEAYLAAIKRFKKVRKFGSAALQLAYVACGREDAYAEDDVMFWDIAAGIALVKAGGGYVHVEPSGAVKWGCKVRCASRESIWSL